MAYTIEVNGAKRTVDVDGDMPLLWVLRDELDLKGSKFGCGAGLCGACTVHVDGKAVRSCLVTVAAVRDGAVATIEGDGGSSDREEIASGLDGTRRAAMRLLPGRPDHAGGGTFGAKAKSERTSIKP
jgi:aerobic-type carbon monoxide dehydrogenase small subunit (CoxS/CutS family)